MVFSFASTLVKRAGTAAELVAFWRMVITTVVWNGIVLMTGRRPSWRSIRMSALPGVFFGLDIAFFYLGATHNSVANAEMISAMTPFIVVPIGAAFFGERLHSRALFFAFFAVGGVALELFAAPVNGDASVRGCIFGVLAHGLMVFAQSTIPIGSIGIARVAQPALAALWSFLLLDEVLNGRQLVGMGIVICGLLGFVLLNQRNNIQPGTLAEPVSATEQA